MTCRPGRSLAPLKVTASTIAHNANDDTANDAGAAGISAKAATVGAADPQVTITNSTIDDNSGQSDGGGIVIVGRRQTADLVLINDTITGNTSASGYLQAGGVASTGSPALASNTVNRGEHDLRPDNRRQRLLRHAQRRAGWSQPDRGRVGAARRSPTPLTATGSAPRPTHSTRSWRHWLPTGVQPRPTRCSTSAARCLPRATSQRARPGRCSGSDQRGQARNAATRAACDIGAYDTGGNAPA